ncbi:MAG: NifB/NifX family molybdenum-iron cluster-binding protein [Acidobacteriota bacterium]
MPSDVTIFVAGRIGGKMSEALESKGIDFISFSGTVEDAVTQALK